MSQICDSGKTIQTLISELYMGHMHRRALPPYTWTAESGSGESHLLRGNMKKSINIQSLGNTSFNKSFNR